MRRNEYHISPCPHAKRCIAMCHKRVSLVRSFEYRKGSLQLNMHIQFGSAAANPEILNKLIKHASRMCGVCVRFVMRQPVNINHTSLATRSQLVSVSDVEFSSSNLLSRLDPLQTCTFLRLRVWSARGFLVCKAATVSLTSLCEHIYSLCLCRWDTVAPVFAPTTFGTCETEMWL